MSPSPDHELPTLQPCDSWRKRSRTPFSGYDIDACTKRLILQVSPSVVSVESYSGKKRVGRGSGIIFEACNTSSSTAYYVLTFASILGRLTNKSQRQHLDLDYTADEDNKIHVYLSSGEMCEGEIFVYDHHFNIAILKIKSVDFLQTVNFKPLDDSLATHACGSQAWASHLKSSLKLLPGDVVIAVGRSFEKPYDLMAAPGTYSIDRFDVELDCKELLRANCKISKCFIGGPLINCCGEVVGINFYAEESTPFLPINLFLKWWECFKLNQNYRRPWLGVVAANLFTADYRVLESIRDLNIFKGVIIEKVASNSPADIAGISPSDIIVKCAGRQVTSFLEFLEIIWDKVGEAVDIEVIRKGGFLTMKMEVEDISSQDNLFYKWPLPGGYGHRHS